MAKDILILQNVIMHYRKALYNLLSENYSITVIHSGKPSITKEDKYVELIVKNKKIGPFYLQDEILKEVGKSKYDAVIAMFDLRWVNTLTAFFRYRKKVKFIWWGAWFTESKIANKIRIYLTKKSEANILYTEAAMLEFMAKGLDAKTLFVANNTFDVGIRVKSYESKIKNSIIFVGSLNKRKQNEVLIEAFFNAKNKIPENIKLLILGDGPEKQSLESLVNDLKLNERVQFLDQITNPTELLNYYESAIVSVSFGQAGLAVLQSLGFGVPFITKKNAISGGEKTNIIHNENGFFCEDNSKSLEMYLIKICNDIALARNMGKFAYEYYTNHCTIENMADGMIAAIESKKQ